MPRRRQLSPAREPPAKPVAAVMIHAHPAYERFYVVVRAIPRGRVATYGQVAAVAGVPRRARQVGYGLHSLPPGSRVPWQRVVNGQGRVSPRADPGAEDLQRALLEREGVRFDARDRIDLRRYGWQPR